MYRIRLLLVLILALSVGGTLAYGTYGFLQQTPVRTMTVHEETRQVVVAAVDLQAGEEMRITDLALVQWPVASVPEGAFTTPQELVGRAVNGAVLKNEAVVLRKLATAAGLPPTIPQGMRAMSVPVNDVVGVAGYVLPGNRVDVLATTNPTGQPADVTTRVVLTDVPVLTAGTKVDDTKTQASQVAVVTLVVTPAQAERLALAVSEGKIQLALRNPLDKSAPDTTGARPANLAGTQPRVATRSSTPRAAQPVDPPARMVDVIRGDKRAKEPVK